MSERKECIEKVKIPAGATFSIENGMAIVKGPKGECEHTLLNPKVDISIEDDTVIISAKNPTKRESTIVGTFAAHIKNMFKGVAEPHIYKLKVCSGHFPMTITIANKQIVVKNFLGEKFPRTVSIRDGASVKIEGDIVIVESTNKELAGQTAANIEKMTHITNRDRRIFQDGIYLIVKDGKQI